MYLSSPLFTWPEMWRGVINRNVELLSRIAHKLFLPNEQLATYVDADGLGVWVAVASRRPEALLREINKQAFRSFAFLGVRDDGRCYWTHFRAL